MAQADTAKGALERVRSLHIGSARDAEAAMHTTRLLATDEQGALTPVAKRFTRTGETRGVMLIGGPGSGKSHLLERTLSKLTVLQEGEYGRPRYLGCSVPSPATFKSMMLALLAESGYPVENPRKEAWSLVQDLRHRLQLLGISVLWIDEAQDLFCADRKLILRALKSLMQGDDAVIVVLSGTEDLAKVIRTDPQVQRRFTAMVLPDLVEQVDGDSFRDVITQYCERVGLGAPTEVDLIGRVFHGARYRFGRALELLLQAMEIAIGRGDDDLDIGHFAAAYAMNEACTAADNVFYAEKYWLLKPDEVEEEERPRRKKR